MTTTEVVEALLWSFGADETLGVPLPDLVSHVMSAPGLLVAYAQAADLDEVQVREARRLAGCIEHGLQPETVGGRSFFLPGVDL